MVELYSFPLAEHLCWSVQEALHFLERLVLLCERNCLALQDFTGEQGPVTALDLGCAVGGSSFALARAFQSVVGVDSSDHLIKAAQVSTAFQHFLRPNQSHLFQPVQKALQSGDAHACNTICFQAYLPTLS